MTSADSVITPAKYCTACGKQLHADCLICPGCGCGTEKYKSKSHGFSTGQLVAFYFLAVFAPAMGFIFAVYAFIRGSVGHGFGLLIAGFFLGVPATFFWAGVFSAMSR